MDWSSRDPDDVFGLFKQELSFYQEDEKITDDAAEVRKFCYGIGYDGLCWLNARGMTADVKENIVEMYVFFEGILMISIDFQIHRLHIMQHH